MKELDRAGLREACREVAKSTLWQAPEPWDISDIIDSGQIERAVEAYYKEAEQRATDFAESGHDPNFVTRAVLYLAYEHAIADEGRYPLVSGERRKHKGSIRARGTAPRDASQRETGRSGPFHLSLP